MWSVASGYASPAVEAKLLWLSLSYSILGFALLYFAWKMYSIHKLTASSILCLVAWSFWMAVGTLYVNWVLLRRYFFAAPTLPRRTPT